MIVPTINKHTINDNLQYAISIYMNMYLLIVRRGSGLLAQAKIVCFRLSHFTSIYTYLLPLSPPPPPFLRTNCLFDMRFSLRGLWMNCNRQIKSTPLTVLFVPFLTLMICIWGGVKMYVSTFCLPNHIAIDTILKNYSTDKTIANLMSGLVSGNVVVDINNMCNCLVKKMRFEVTQKDGDTWRGKGKQETCVMHSGKTSALHTKTNTLKHTHTQWYNVSILEYVRM